MRAAEIVKHIAAEHHAKPGQIALAWVLAKGDNIIPIPGTKRRTYLEENLAAATITLSTSQMQALDAAMALGKIAGPRYAPAIMATIDR